MATSLAAQLAQISAKSKSSLDVKAQKAAHSKSLIFEPRIAAGQSFQTLYTICKEGFEELCTLDHRFAQFGTTLFSEQSKDEERSQMSAAENAVLDKRIESFLRLIGGRLRLMPAIKSLEWLIRRFRVHEFNTASLLATFLPYHTLSVFQTLMSILPATLPHDYRFLDPYIRSLTSPPRAAIVQQAIQNASLLSSFSQHVILSCRLQQHHAAQVSFWAGLMTEATNGLLDKMRSGRKSIQADNNQALLQQIGPIISESMAMSRVPELQIASYMVASVLAAKGGLGDAALSAFMEQTVHAWTTETLRPGLFCLALLAHFRSSKQTSGRVTRALLKLDKPLDVLREVAQSRPVDKLLYGVSLSALDRFARKGDIDALPWIKTVLLSELLLPKQISVIVKTLLITAHRTIDNGGDDAESRKLLAHTLATLTQAGGQSGNVIRAAVQEADIDVEALELSLDTLIRPIVNHEQGEADVDVDATPSPTTAGISVEETLAQLPAWDATSMSCLLKHSTSPFDDICAVFLSMASDPATLTRLDDAPAMRRASATRDPFYFSFYARVWCGPYSTLARVRALEEVTIRVKEPDCRQLDLQALIPYCLTALCDDAKRVRSAATALIITLGTLYTVNDDTKRNVWGSKDLYDRANDIKWMESKTVEVLLHSILLPTLEESILQPNHSSTVLGEILNSSSKGGGIHNISRSARLEIFRCLANHVLQTPLLSVLVRLLSTLNLVRGVSDVTRTQLLLPWLREWASLSAGVASGRAAKEKIDEQIIDHESAEVVLPNDRDGLELFLDLIRKPEFEARQGLLRAIFERLSSMWSSMKVDNKLLVARTMLTVSLRPERHSNAALGAADFLRTVALPTIVLQELLEELQSIVGAVADVPPSKRRRTSSSDHSRVAGSAVADGDVAALLQKYTFVLELVEGATPVKHPELLQSLFMTLSDLQHLRAVVGSDLGYLQNLALSSLLAMMPAYEANKDLKIDTSVGHGDILVSYIQKSASPAVQNAALLLVATLAKTAPDVVLHSVMPIFTFMGTSILRQGDEYSAHVINQTIKDVVPPLINRFRKSRRNIVASAADLLSSFVIAYEHIPSHRKNELFLSLVDNLGADDFLFALLAMFIDKYGTPPPLVAFLSHIMETFRVEIQLQTLIKFMDLVHDVFRPKPGLSAVILGRYDDGEKDLQKVAAKELALLPGLLGNRRLKADISELAQQDNMESARMRDLYAQLLQSTLALADEVKAKKMLYSRCGDVLSSLLNLLSVPAFIRAAESLLDRSKSGLRTRVLQALQSRVDAESANSADSRNALLAFLPQLTADIRETDDIPYKLTAVSCVDKIAEKYGKKDVETVAAAAETIAGPQCLGQPDKRLRTISLLCLASLADVLQDALVPILPSAIPLALDYLNASVDANAYDVSLHNAALTFITAVVQHLPFMISESYLTGTLAACNLSAEVMLDESAIAQRKACLAFLAKRVDAKVFFPALEHNFAPALQAGPHALREYLEVLGLAVEQHPKSAITKNITPLSAIFLGAFDLRRILQSSESSFAAFPVNIMGEVEEAVNILALKFIYKLNDAALRPIFTELMEWTAAGPSKQDYVGRRLRQQSVYNFLSVFFDNLKSIVTSYASYVIDGAVAILKSIDPKSSSDRELWIAVLRTLTSCFEHDQDSFWQAPSHFDMVAPVLTTQLLHAPSTTSSASAQSGSDLMGSALTPAIVELAAAADSADHQKELNTSILRHLRAKQAGVRLAAVKCQQALTERLGEDWLTMLPEMLPYISELQDDDDEMVEREVNRWILGIEGVLGERLDAMLQ